MTKAIRQSILQAMANTKPLSRRQLKKLTYRQLVAEWRRQSILKEKRSDVKQKPEGKN